MSSERQRKLRLQGRFSGPTKAAPVRGLHQQSISPKSSDNGPAAQRESLSPQPLVYTKTDCEAEQKPSEPVCINDEPEKFCSWFQISESENGPSWIYFDPKFLSQETADATLAKILGSGVPWEDKAIVIQGEKHPMPRLVHWVGPYEYKYSSVTLKPNDNWPEGVLDVLREIEKLPRYREDSQGGLNSVLLNLYRNEKDSVAWHSDNEMSMGVRPFIASVSLGASRRFHLARKPPPSTVIQDKALVPEYAVHLDHGSLIIMNGALQDDWLHRVPKEFHNRDLRLNLTFRTVFQT